MDRAFMIKATVFGTDCTGNTICRIYLTARRRKAIRIWGQQHKRCLKAIYTMLPTSNKLNTCLTEIARQIQEHVERLIEQMDQAWGITDQLKTDNALEWVGRPGNIRACAMGVRIRESYTYNRLAEVEIPVAYLMAVDFRLKEVI